MADQSTRTASGHRIASQGEWRAARLALSSRAADADFAQSDLRCLISDGRPRHPARSGAQRVSNPTAALRRGARPGRKPSILAFEVKRLRTLSYVASTVSAGTSIVMPTWLLGSCSVTTESGLVAIWTKSTGDQRSPTD